MVAILTLLLPAFYIAVATFHHEVIDRFLLSISQLKRVPFPTVLKSSMELSELIREAGVRNGLSGLPWNCRTLI